MCPRPIRVDVTATFSNEFSDPTHMWIYYVILPGQLYSTPTSTGGDDLGGYARIKPAAPKN